MEEFWQSLLITLSVPALSAIVAAISAWWNKIRASPEKRKYWENQLRERLEIAKEFPDDDMLRRRAEIAVRFLDADEAIRRAGVPGAAMSWIAAIAAYIMGLAVFVPIQTGEGTSGHWVVALLLGLAGAAVQIDAILIPPRRRTLQRILMEVTQLPGGHEAITRSPESLVNLWSNRSSKKELRKNAVVGTGLKPREATHAACAKALLSKWKQNEQKERP